MFTVADLGVQNRRTLFHQQTTRFLRCECRRPNWQELRAIWRSTGFPTLVRH